jgi:5'-3' exonuclease
MEDDFMDEDKQRTVFLPPPRVYASLLRVAMKEHHDGLRTTEQMRRDFPTFVWDDVSAEELAKRRAAYEKRKKRRLQRERREQEEWKAKLAEIRTTHPSQSEVHAEHK